MKKTDAKRQIITEKIADYLLLHGLKAASLRPLATAAGTSDRMLLHYFTDKEELLTATLILIAKRLVGILKSVRSEQMPFHTLLPFLAEMMKDPQIRPYLRLWLEMAAFAAGGEKLYRAIARQIYDDFLNWITLALQVDREEDRMSMASLALATVEGFVLLDAIDYGSQVTSALKGIAIRQLPNIA
jgi:AcrR family transcriptional regulator